MKAVCARCYIMQVVYVISATLAFWTITVAVSASAVYVCRCNFPTQFCVCYIGRLAVNIKLECGPMPNVMAALPNIGGAFCSTPQNLADAHYYSAVQ